jgi:hypothetical protein
MNNNNGGGRKEEKNNNNFLKIFLFFCSCYGIISYSYGTGTGIIIPLRGVLIPQRKEGRKEKRQERDLICIVLDDDYLFKLLYIIGQNTITAELKLYKIIISVFFCSFVVTSLYLL